MDTRSVMQLVGELDVEPSLRGVLEDALRWHREHSGSELALGFVAGEVHATSHVLRRLLSLRVVDQTYQSRSQTCFKLADVEAVQEALRVADDRRLRAFPAGCPEPREDRCCTFSVSWPACAAAREAQAIPEDLFDVVVGLEREKRIVRAALDAPRPVHVLLVGPPACAKSLFLSELERLPGARRALGPTTTRAGIVGYLLDEPGCRLLLVDEIDRADPRDMEALYGLMAEGRVERLKHRRSEQEQRVVWVFATANDAGVLREALRSRFVVLEIAPYTEEEFRQVALGVLVRREGVDEELAVEIAAAVAPWTRDPRAAVHIARLCQGERRQVAPLVREVLEGR